MRPWTLSTRSRSGIGEPATTRRREQPKATMSADPCVSGDGVHGWPARQAVRCRATWNAGRGLHSPLGRRVM